MNDLALKQDTSGYRSSVDSRWVICDELGVFTREPVVRFEVVIFALRSTYVHRVRLTQAGRRLQSIQGRMELTVLQLAPRSSATCPAFFSGACAHWALAGFLG